MKIEIGKTDLDSSGNPAYGQLKYCWWEVCETGALCGSGDDEAECIADAEIVGGGSVELVGII